MRTLVIGVMMFATGIAAAQGVKPTLGVDHLTRIQTVLKLQDAAQNSCKELLVTKNYVAAQKETTEGIEAAYAGWTLDWAKMILVEKTK
jgi:hypothetical protein